MTSFVAIDFETANSAPDSACALGMVRVEDGQVTAELSLMIRPPSPRFTFSWLHGIGWDQVKDAPDFAGHWPSIRNVLRGADFLAAHNAPFDRNVLRASCARHDIAPPRRPFLCTVMLARRLWDIRPTKLPDVCRWLCIDLPNHHDALCDARACAEIVRCGLTEPAAVALLPNRRRGPDAQA